MEQIFSRIAQLIGQQLGKPHTFALACALVVVWAATGPIFGYSDTWQLVINTGTTIITFLMVFLLQNTQNRDTQVIKLKLDELILANEKARNALLGLEELTDKQMRRMHERFASLGRLGASPEELGEAQEELQRAKQDVSEAQEHLARAAERTPPA